MILYLLIAAAIVITFLALPIFGVAIIVPLTNH